MDEIDKHYLIFSSPHIYKCSCGVVAWLFPDEQKIAEMPKGKIKYLPCGHAACAKTEKVDCLICLMKGTDEEDDTPDDWDDGTRIL